LPHIIVTQELILTGYTCDELFFDSSLIDATNKAISTLLKFSKTIPSVIIIGTPLYTNHGLYNVALVISDGCVLGAIPKSYLPIGGEFYEARYFDTLDISQSINVSAFGCEFELSCAQVFDIHIKNRPSSLPISISAEICEDMWAPLSPSTIAFASGANVVFNLSASNAIYTKDDVRRTLANAQTQKFSSAYIYVSAGEGESNNDLVWDGEIFVSCCGRIQYSNKPFESSSTVFLALPDYSLQNSKFRARTANRSCILKSNKVSTKIYSSVDANLNSALYLRLDCVLRYPYSNSNFPFIDDKLANYIINSLCQALYTRMHGASVTSLVLGVSGGLDSTFALLILYEFVSRYNLPEGTIRAITLPTKNTSQETLNDAKGLCTSFGITLQEVPLQTSVDLRLSQLGRDPDLSPKDTTYENVQAGERTSYLFRLANSENGLVVGTGDLSEMALGWCTYGVGDQMSHYALNCGIPKTVIKQFIEWYLKKSEISEDSRTVLFSISNRTISPELLPSTNNSKAIQDTESTIGKYILIDFFLFYYLEYSITFDQLGILAKYAFSDIVTTDQINTVITSFKNRFFRSQFKRTAIPNGPKILANGSLSPRSDWRQPSITYIYHSS
jgi:NAD+ synthase (glutamine-hydrolysing)